MTLQSMYLLRQLAAVANKDIEKVSTNLGQAILSKSQRQMTIREIQRSRLDFESRWAERYPPPILLYSQETLGQSINYAQMYLQPHYGNGTFSNVSPDNTME